MFAGFRSRWTIPFSCAASSASAICRAIVSASAKRQARRSLCAWRSCASRVGERLALDELEDQEPDAVGLLEAVDRADVRMIQRGEHARLALEAREPVGVARERARQDLDRDVAPELRVARAVHLAHAAGAEQRLQVIAAERLRRSCRGTARRGSAALPVIERRRREIRRRTRLVQQRFDVAPQRLVLGDRPRRETRRARPAAGRAPRDTAPRSAASVQASCA